MPTWPQPLQLGDGLLVFSTLAGNSFGATASTTAPGTANWPTANLAIYTPFRLSSAVRVAQLWWHNGTVVGPPNVDAGIYAFGEDGGLRRLVSTGSTAQGSSSVLQVVDVTDIELPPGLYAHALVVSANSSGMFRSAPGTQLLRAIGVVSQASALPLPATGTAAAATASYLPVHGFTARTVI